MRFRKLRIAWTATCVIACIPLCALWIRSHWWHDDIIYDKTWKAIAIKSELGRIDFTYLIFDVPSHSDPGLSVESFDVPAIDTDPPTPAFQIDWKYKHVVFPHGLPIASLAVLASLPWIRWRFTLRALLIATTLVAVGLGLVVWLR